MPIDFDAAGWDEVRRRVEALGQSVPKLAADALRTEAELIMTVAKERTPVLTGALRASGHVDGPETAGPDATVTLKFGGPAAPYAVFVHENMESNHPVGQAKFLESALLEKADGLADRIAARVAAKVGQEAQ